MSQLVQGSTVATVNSADFIARSPQEGISSAVDIELYGTFTGFSAQLQRKMLDGSYVAVGAPVAAAGLASVTIGVESGRTYRLAITGTAPTGTCLYRVGQ